MPFFDSQQPLCCGVGVSCAEFGSPETFLCSADGLVMDDCTECKVYRHPLNWILLLTIGMMGHSRYLLQTYFISHYCPQTFTFLDNPWLCIGSSLSKACWKQQIIFQLYDQDMRGVVWGKSVIADMPSNMHEERGRSQKSRSRSASSKSSSSSKSSRSRSSSRSKAGSANSSRSRSRSSSKSSRSPVRFVSRSRSRSNSSRSRSRSRSKSPSKSPVQTPRSSSPVQTPRSSSPVQTPRSSSSESRDRSKSVERTRLPSPPTEAPRGLLRQVKNKTYRIGHSVLHLFSGHCIFRVIR